MKNAPKTGGKASPESKARLRELPSVDQLLARRAVSALVSEHGRPIVVRAARSAIAEMRRAIGRGGTPDGVSDAETLVRAQVASALAPSLRRVINATGVILHTNLGRAPLSTEAASAIAATSTRYSNLEYDIAAGKRGRRDVHTSAALAELAGAEAAIVVNNNAAAIFLVLHALAKGQEVIVSRGELIEIGDGFRIPDIMTESGAVLREVGTTNRTHIRDYESAINEHTRLILRVHPSEFSHHRIHRSDRRLKNWWASARSFTCQCTKIWVRAAWPILRGRESRSRPCARAAIAGADVVTYSSDKLLGGPQAGIIAGKRELDREDPAQSDVSRAARGQADDRGAGSDGACVSARSDR